VLFWDARPWTPAAASEREALGVLGNLFAKPLCKADVLEYVLTLPAITPEARQRAQKLMDRYREETDSSAYHQASWAIVRQPHLNAFQYRFALRQAETAWRLAPKNTRYWTALGAAQYRAGQYSRARATLARAESLHRTAASLALSARQFPEALVTILQANSLGQVVIVNHAFLGMTYHELGHEESALAALAHLREIADKPEWSSAEAAMSLVREARTLMAGNALPEPAPVTKK
jgi:tetratricopeptide (TPR) repeat protein